MGLAPQMLGQIAEFFLRERGGESILARRLMVGIGFALAVMLIVFAGKALDSQLYAQSEASQWVKHTRDVELTLTQLQYTMAKAESAVRGYTITGKPDYLGSYDAAKAATPALVKSLRDLTADNPARRGALDAIADLIAQKFAFLDQGIAARENGPATLAALIAKGQGKLIMDQLQAKSAAVIQDEERLLAERQMASDAAIAHGLLLARLSAGLGIVLLCIAFGWVALAMHFTGKAQRLARAAILARDAADALRMRHEAQVFRDQSTAIVGRLAGGLAHVLNNSLTVILGHSELMAERSGRSETDRQSLAAISTSAVAAASLIDKFRSFGQRQALMPEDVDLNECLNDLKRFTGALSSGVTVEFKLGPFSPRSFVDRQQLLTALTALFENAVEAMPNGGRLTVACTERSLTDAEAVEAGPGLAGGNYAEIAVADTGIGMSEEVRRHAFEPFYSTKDASLGAGLGLGMAYGFVRQSRGHIALESVPGKGTLVRILLPALSDQRETTTASPAHSPIL